MPYDSIENRERLRSSAVGLTFACPYDQGNPVDCPLCSLRQRPVEERLQWVDGLTDQEMRTLLKFHHECLRAKERREADGAAAPI